MHEHWRLIIDEPLDGPTNMARDEAIARAHAAGDTPPTLRLYAWRPACLSLGRFQRSAELNRAACADAGVAIVRRPSGGRALLHDHELTYAVVAREDHPLLGGDSIVASYRQISAALLAGLRALGVAAELTPHRRPGDRRPTTDDRQPTTDDQQATSHERPGSNTLGQLSPGAGPSSAACFDAPASYELTVRGRKLVGSAQRRQGGVLLQHGAIPLAPHAERLCALLLHPPPDLRQRMIALSEVAGRPIDFDTLAEALIGGFATTWGARFAPGRLSAAELALERELRASTYASDSWTFAR